MRLLPNLLALAWALLVLGSLVLTGTPAGVEGAQRALSRIENFLLWQGTALLVAMIAGGLSVVRRDRFASRGWWFGWGPLLGSVIVAVFVGLAVLATRLF